MNRNKVIIIIGAVLIILTCFIGVFTSKKTQNVTNSFETYEVRKSDNIGFAGEAIAAQEEKHFIDPTKGELSKVNVKDGDEVVQGTVLYTYLNSQISKELEDKKEELALYDNQIADLNARLDELRKNQTNTQSLDAVEIKSKIEALNSQIDTIKEQEKASNSQMKRLSEQEYIDVASNIDGIVYINDEARNDITKEFQTVVSKNTVIKASVTEFDKNKLSLNQNVSVYVISNGENIHGTISKIDTMPVKDSTGSNVYNFYVVTDKNVDLGFSVEVSLEENKIVIPEECIFSEGNKYYVYKVIDGEKKKHQINVEKSEEGFLLKDGSLNEGDKILKDKDEILKLSGEKND